MSMNDTSESKQRDVQRKAEEVGREIDQIRRMGEERLEDLREIGGQLRQRVEDEIRNRPFAAVGVAFGAGVLVSTIVSSKLARFAILAAGGYAAREMLGERLMEVLGPVEEDETHPRARRRGRRSDDEPGGSSR
jgi:ElaB/YqjD/DUF883 family membrane-anchored ribosome-binding protein